MDCDKSVYLININVTAETVLLDANMRAKKSVFLSFSAV